MSLSAHEQQALDSIQDGLTDSGLVTLLGTFNQLALDEDMPASEKIEPGSRAAAGCASRSAITRRGRLRRGRHPHRGCRYPRQGYRRAGQWVPALLLLTITLSLIGIALAFSRIGSPVKCDPSLALVCAHPESTHVLYPAAGTGS